MARTTTQQEQPKKTVSYGQKFGLDKDRKKLEAGFKNFDIVKIVMTDSKKRYDGIDPDTDQVIHGRKKIAQIDVTLENGNPAKFYAMNTAIVDACLNILDDDEIGHDENGTLNIPVHIDEVISGKGEKNRDYIAFA